MSVGSIAPYLLVPGMDSGVFYISRIIKHFHFDFRNSLSTKYINVTTMHFYYRIYQVQESVVCVLEQIPPGIYRNAPFVQIPN